MQKYHACERKISCITSKQANRKIKKSTRLYKVTVFWDNSFTAYPGSSQVSLNLHLLHYRAFLPKKAKVESLGSSQNFFLSTGMCMSTPGHKLEFSKVLTSPVSPFQSLPAPAFCFIYCLPQI
jgi:hypothetical protein